MAFSLNLKSATVQHWWRVTKARRFRLVNSWYFCRNELCLYETESNNRLPIVYLFAEVKGEYYTTFLPASLPSSVATIRCPTLLSCFASCSSPFFFYQFVDSVGLGSRELDASWCQSTSDRAFRVGVFKSCWHLKPMCSIFSLFHTALRGHLVA